MALKFFNIALVVLLLAVAGVYGDDCAVPACPSIDPSTGTFPVALFPNPMDCAQYIICDNGVPVIKQCPVGLIFNPEVEVCDFSWNYECTQCEN